MALCLSNFRISLFLPWHCGFDNHVRDEIILIDRTPKLLLLAESAASMASIS